MLLIYAVEFCLEYGFLTCQVRNAVVVREGDGDVEGLACAMADDLVFEARDIGAGAEYQVRTLAIGRAAFEFHAVDGADIVDINRIAFFRNGHGIVIESLGCS